MRFILGLIAILLVLDALWWLTAMRLAKSPPVRVAAGLFSLSQIAALLWLISQRVSHLESTGAFSKFSVTLVFIWHMIILPVLLLTGITLLPVIAVLCVVRMARRRRPAAAATDRNVGLTRRQFLGTACAAAPPLFALSLSSVAMRQLDHFRVRRFTIPIADLPRDLHGLSIAQVSDMHVGRFTSGRILAHLVRVVNELRTDLILLTGDLINDALADLDYALGLACSMQARFGTYLIEGNHDLIENGAEFERRVKESSIPFLLDESALITIRGMPVQLLGLSWTRTREKRDEAIAASVRRLLHQRIPETFPILLAHHPHAWDAAAEAALPLTLSGHTHGGQLMWNDQHGFGPALFRYWSGLYSRGPSKLVVSNGVGNWFPLRVRAPAELVHLTLLRM